MNHWKIVKSIWQKVEAKNPVDTVGTMFVKKLTNYPLRIMITRDSTKAPGRNNHNGGSGGTGFRIVSKNYNTATKTHAAGGIHFLNFDTEQERYNAWQSYLTKFARFCICMDESTKLAPYMGNYTQPWDDQRFYEYFGLNKIEIQLIETVIK